MTFTASELDPPLARWPDVAHVAEEGCRCSSSFPSYASRSGSHFFSTRESSLRLPSSLSRQINRSNLTNYRILLSGPLPTDEVSSSPFFSFPSTSSSFHPRNQKRSPPEQFYPFVGKRLGPARKPGDNPLPLLPTIPRPVRLRELLPPRSSRLNDAASRPFRHSRRGGTSTINGQTIA